MARDKRKKPRKIEHYEAFANADPSRYGIDPFRGAVTTALRMEKRRQEQENYEYWRANAGLSTNAPGRTTTGAAQTGLTLQGTNIVPSGQPTVGSQPATTGIVAAGTAAPTAIKPTASVPGQPVATPPNLATNEAGVVQDPAAQEKARQALEEAKAANPDMGFVEKGLHFLTQLFNTEDTFAAPENDPSRGLYEQTATGGDLNILGIPLGGVETAFDGFMRTMNWGYDRLNQAGAMGTSWMPGGVDNITWDDARNISWGQVAVTDAAQRTNQMEAMGLGALAAPVNALGGGIVGGMFGTVAALGDNEMAPFASPTFDITSEQQRKAAFEDSTVGKWFTGLTDTAITIVADPLIVAGKALKITKLRYVDRLIKTEDDILRVAEELDYGKHVFATNGARVGDDGLEVGKQIEYMTPEEMKDLRVAPIAMFAQAASRKTEDGRKALTLDEIYNHTVIKNAANRDALSYALYNTESYDEAALILRHAAGDSRAMVELNQMRPDLLLDIVNGERALVNQILRSSPSLIAKEAAKWEKRYDSIALMLKRLDEADVPEDMKIQIRESAAQVQTKWMEAKAGELPPIGTGSAATKAEIKLLNDAAEKRLQRNEAFIRSLENAKGELSETYGVLQGSTKGFSSNTKFGRAVEASRQKRATQKSISQGRVGETSPWKFWQVDEFYGARGANPVARVLHWAGSERASGMITTKGIGAQESAREIRAVLNNMRMFSGDAKMVDGKAIGGWQRKEEILQEYQRAMLMGDTAGEDAARRIIDQLEERLMEEVSEFHGLPKDFMKQQHYWQSGQLRKISDEIREQGYWVDEKGSKNYAPYLESQLQSMTFMKNWKKIDEIAEKASKSNQFARTKDGIIDFTAANVGILNSFLQDFWRPAVLIRGGYTQRNLAEGLFRASAYEFSLRPWWDAARQGSRSIGNTRRLVGDKISRHTREVTESATGGATLDKMPKRFRKWHEAQVTALADEIATNEDMYRTGLAAILRESPQYRMERLEALADKAKSLGVRSREARKNGDVEDADELQRQLTDLIDEMHEIRAMTGGDVDITPAVRSVIDNLEYLEDIVQPMYRNNLEALSDMTSAAALYRKQTLAKRRLYDGQTAAIDNESLEAVMKGLALQEAFDQNSGYANIALANLSADKTMMQAVGMRSEAVSAALKIKQVRHYVEISPDDPDKYFPAVARVLNQWQNSQIGRIIVEGRADDLTSDQIIENVVERLFDGQEGLDLRNFLNDADELHFGTKTDTEHGGAYRGVAELRAEAQERAAKAVEPLDEQINLLQVTVKSLNARRSNAIRDFNKRQAATPGRKLTEYRMTMPDGSVKKFRSKDKLDEFVGKQRLELDDLRTRRQKEYDEAAKFGVDEHRINVADVEDAAVYASRMLDRYDQLTAGSVPLQRYLRGNPLEMPKGKPQESGQIVRTFLEAKDAEGRAIYDLKPVIGDDEIALGTKTMRDVYKGVVDKTFSIIGTMPEDLFTRAPFYGRRYKETAQRSYNILVSQVGEKGITMNHVNAIRELAHRRALKDTKDWLYTIDRRTAFGDVMENWMPFASAMQNSVTTVGRLVWNDPSIVGVMRLIWQAPDDLNDPNDPDNPDMFALPIGWVPEGIRETVGLDEYLRFDKQRFDLIFQGVNLDGGAAPLMAVTQSELLKHSLGGNYTEEPPDFIKAISGGDDGLGASIWQAWMDFNFGKGFGASESFASLDMLLPAHQRMLVDAWIKGDGSSAAYARTFNNIRMSENYKWAMGYRSEPPSYEEVEGKARGMMTIRAAIAGFAFTTPKYQNEMDELARVVRDNDKAWREDQALPEDQRKGILPSEELFGDAAVWVSQNSTRSNNAGFTASSDATQIANEYSGLIRELAPAVAEDGDLSLLGMLDPNWEDFYAFDNPDVQDPTAKAWQIANEIPGGGGEAYREISDLALEQYNSNVEYGWKKWIKGKQQIEAVMNQAGYYSWTAAGAAPYAELKEQLKDAITGDPMAKGWRDVFEKQSGGTRARNAVGMVDKILGDQKFRDAHAEDPIWGYGGAAETYMTNRRMLLEEMNRLDIGSLQSRKGGNYRGTLSGLADLWAQAQGELRAAVPAWGVFQDRFIGEDDDPFEVFTSAAMVQEPVTLGPPPPVPGMTTTAVPQEGNYGY